MQSQAWAVAELVARRLGVEVEPEARSDALRGRSADEQPIAEAVAEAAGHLRIAFLYREFSVDDMTRVIAEAAFPAVLLGAGRDPDDVIVLTGRRGGVADGTLVDRSGATRTVELGVDGLKERAGAGSIRALLPVEVGPYVSRAEAEAVTRKLRTGYGTDVILVERR